MRVPIVYSIPIALAPMHSVVFAQAETVDRPKQLDQLIKTCEAAMQAAATTGFSTKRRSPPFRTIRPSSELPRC